MIKIECISAELKKLRLRCKLSQDELAELTGLSQAAISKVESKQNFKMDTFLALYNFYCSRLDSAMVTAELFKYSNTSFPIVIEQFKLLANKHYSEFEKFIADLE